MPRLPSRTRLGIAALAVAAVVASGAIAIFRPRQSIAPGAFAGRNLLFVTIDTLRPDRLGSYGSTAGLTPHLDRLASEGVRFERVLAHVPLTLPAHTRWAPAVTTWGCSTPSGVT